MALPIARTNAAHQWAADLLHEAFDMHAQQECGEIADHGGFLPMEGARDLVLFYWLQESAPAGNG